MRIGLLPGARRDAMNLADTVRQVVQAENDGFDSVWFPQMSGFGFDALTIISMAGAQTERIELGTAVIPTFPTHPLAMAKHALTAQVACGGRLTLGLGLSHKPSVNRIRHPDTGRCLPVHPIEIPLSGQVPFAVQFHCGTLVRRERGSPGRTPRGGSWVILRWLLLVLDATDVRRGRGQHRLDAGVGVGHGLGEEYALGKAAQ